MPKFVATDHKITINGTDLSSSLQSVDLSLTADEVDTTAFGGGWRTMTSGLRSATLTLNFFQDFAAGAVDATLAPLFGSQATVTITPTSTAVSATNPSWSGLFLVSQYQPYANSVGDIATLSVTWPSAGTISRATA